MTAPQESLDKMSTHDNETPWSEQSKASSPVPMSNLLAAPSRAKVDADAGVDRMLIKSLEDIQHIQGRANECR